MPNILRIYDFELEHKELKKTVTFYDLAVDHPELQTYIKLNGLNSETLKWDIILDAIKHKFSNDLNKEKLKNSTTQRIVKRGYKLNHKKEVELKDLNIDNKDFLIYSTLNGGKITDKSILEKVSTKEGNNMQMLNGDRIYDEMFFLLHVSFTCNKARLFTLTRSNNLNLDSTIKSYFAKNMFKCENFISSSWQIYIPTELQQKALERTVINNIAITKTLHLNNQAIDVEFEIENKLKSKKKGVFSKITTDIVDLFRKTQITLNGYELMDDGGIVKFNITDPETNTKKSVVYGDTDDFIPKLALEDRAILKKDLTLDEIKLKKICLDYIVYDKKGTF
jgi:hypothetical protein